MFDADLAIPFGFGIVAAFNPCGFAMLPIFVSFFLGKDSEGEGNKARQLLRALKVASVLTLGFILVFGIFGVLTALAADLIKPNLPYVVMVLGVMFVPLGIAMLRGWEPKVNIPRLQKGGDSDELASMFLFGVSYAVVSLGCTIGPFAATSTGGLTKDNFGEGVAVFLAYGLGMGAVITTLTIGLALARTSIATNMRKVLPWVNRISGVLLVLSGLYLALYGWWEYQVLIKNNLTTNPLVDFFTNIQSGVTQWTGETGTSRLGVGLFIIIGAVLLRGFWGDLKQNQRLVGGGILFATWAYAELVWQKADLFILPIIRTIVGYPERIGNWFTDPIRWAVLGEILVLALIALTLWFRFGRKSASPETPLVTSGTPGDLSSTMRH